MRLCDLCGLPLEVGGLRFVVKVQAYAAPDNLEITSADLARDHEAEIRRLAGLMENMSEEDLMRDVFVEFVYDLCPACHRRYTDDPLGPFRADA